MLASARMRATRELRSPAAAALALSAGALFFGGGSGNGSLPWLGLAAVVVLLVLMATVGPPGNLAFFVPLAALAVWCALSVSWSIEPDRSWAYANRAFLY